MRPTPDAAPDDSGPTAVAVEVADVGSVMWIPSPTGAPVRIGREVLDRALAGGPAALVWAAAEADVARALASAWPLPAGAGAAAVHVPVVDALKRVEGQAVVEAVDRTALRRLVAPAVVDPAALAAVLGEAGRGDPSPDAVRPLALLAAAGRVVALEGSDRT